MAGGICDEAVMLEPSLARAVLKKLGCTSRPAPNYAGLQSLYAAWCARVPFDNLRKLTALHVGTSEALPGIEAQDFFEAWLEHGCGATCWPSSNACYELLASLEFDCRRITGSMRDCARINHGSVVVRFADGEWLADSSMLTGVPVPLRAGIYVSEHPLFDYEVEAQGADYVVWNDFQPAGLFPCRLFPASADWPECAGHYEGSRGMSPFNRRVYARRAEPGCVSVLTGTSLYQRTAAGVAVKEIPGELLGAVLRDVFGFSVALLAAWQQSGAAAANLEPPPADAPPPPPIQGVPPSRRARSD